MLKLSFQGDAVGRAPLPGHNDGVHSEDGPGQTQLERHGAMVRRVNIWKLANIGTWSKGKELIHTFHL